FEAMLGDLFRRGAFAGSTAASAFQVVTGESLNTAPSVEQGRFIVELRVAPARPMAFLTLRLVQTGERVTVTGASASPTPPRRPAATRSPRSTSRSRSPSPGRRGRG